MMRLTRVVSLCLAIIFAALPASAQPKLFDSLYVFGDSLGDTGNLFEYTAALGADPAIPPSVSPHQLYYRGRFSNGPIAFEYLWWLIKQRPYQPTGGLQSFLRVHSLASTAAVSFAFGGSSTGALTPLPGGIFIPGLNGQVELFRSALKGKPPSSRALYTIVAGSNDYLGLPVIPDGGQHAIAAQVVANIGSAIGTLYSLGARDVMVLNVADLGLIPLVALDPARSASLSRLSAAHNAALAASMGTLTGSLPGIRLRLIDLQAVMAGLPQPLLLTPAVDSLLPPPPALGGLPMSFCIFVNPQACEDVPTFDVDPAYLFWDAEHPTTSIHQLLAQYLYFVLQGS